MNSFQSFYTQKEATFAVLIRQILKRARSASLRPLCVETWAEEFSQRQKISFGSTPVLQCNITESAAIFLYSLSKISV